MVSANTPMVSSTVELNVAEWYINDSRDEAHCIFPPRDSIFSTIASSDVDLVDLNARRSIMWLTPRSASFSYLEPAST